MRKSALFERRGVTGRQSFSSSKVSIKLSTRDRPTLYHLGYHSSEHVVECIRAESHEGFDYQQTSEVGNVLLTLKNFYPKSDCCGFSLKSNIVSIDVDGGECEDSSLLYALIICLLSIA